MGYAKLDIRRKSHCFQSISNIQDIHLALITNISKSNIKELNKIQKEFIWKNKNPKIKHTTLCNNYDNGSLKNVNIS